MALALRFTRPSPLNAVLITAAYLAMCVAAFLVKRLKPLGAAASPVETGGFTGTAAVFFGIFVLFMLDQTSGFSASVDVSGSAGTMILPALAGIAGLALAFAFPIILFVDAKRTIEAGTTRYEVSHTVALVIVNTMALFLLAFWRAYFETGTEPYEDLAMGAKILIFVCVYIVYLLFLTAPRLLLLSLDKGNLAVTSFLLSSAYFVWMSLSTTAW